MIGLGEEHDAAFLGMLADIGTERGKYEYVSKSELSKGDLSKVEKFYETSVIKEDKQPGIAYTLPDSS